MKLKYKILSNVPMPCWYCDAKTFKAIYLLDGSEVWCCVKCFKIKGKVRRKRISIQKSMRRQESAILGQNSLVEYGQKSILKVRDPNG